MKSVLRWVAALSLVTGCSSSSLDGDGAIRSSHQELDSSKTTNLTKGGQDANLKATSDEAVRQAETRDGYYSWAGGLTTLDLFRSIFTFDANEVTATYYNRGDLGIGREMHCVDVPGTIACYVRNFAAGDDGSEFTFGMSPDIAFKNTNAGHAFATVAMIFQDTPDPTTKMRFLVYNAAGDALLNAAALDRVGIIYNNAFSSGASLVGLGTPGQNFNNHIPSNCATCHGGSYDSINHTVSGSFFLPFDLDQFEYENVVGHRLIDQQDQFRQLNAIVRKVAILANPTVGGSIVNQIDGWYGGDLTSGTFDSNYVPTGWRSSQAAIDAYQGVVRASCRNCHLTNRASILRFDDEAGTTGFRVLAVTAAEDIRDFVMPHSLQSLRTFWQSPQPAALEKYFISVGETLAATTLHNSGPGNVATLDPHQISALQLGQ